MLNPELLGHWAVTLQGVLLGWTKHFKVRGVQDTDVVSSLRKALQKHKASFVPAGGGPEGPRIVPMGGQLLVRGLFWELSNITSHWHTELSQGWPLRFTLRDGAIDGS